MSGRVAMATRGGGRDLALEVGEGAVDLLKVRRVD